MGWPIEDMMLDPEVAVLLDSLSKSQAPALYDLPPDEAKETYRRARLALATPDRANVTKRDLLAEGPFGPIPLRLYTPVSRVGETLPALVFYHGGGFTVGDLDTHDGVCQHLCDKAGIAVVAVQYRVAPEFKFPAPIDDSYAALIWISQNAGALGIDASQLAIGGDSAGGCLSAVLSLMARDRGGPELRLQMLIYPTTDLAHTLESHTRLGTGYMLSTALLYYFRNLYLSSPAEIEDWRASPLRAPDHRNLPPAWILTAGYDPLSDEGEAYAERLQASGVRVTTVRFPGQIHGFITMGKILPQALDALDQAAAVLVTTFGLH